MIVHCKTVEEIEDVIHTEKLIFSDFENNYIKFTSRNFNILLDTYKNDWYVDGYIENITPYADWKNKTKERYEMKFEDSILKCECTFDYDNMVKILQSLGYKVEAPYIPPTDEEILARIKFENKKIGYVADWSSTDEKYQVTLDTDRNVYRLASRIYTKDIGVVYTTREIATQIVVELNEKRFERVSE